MTPEDRPRSSSMVERSRLIRIVIALWAGLAAPAFAAPQVSPVPQFTRDVAPIFYARCTTCHRPGQVSPMSLLTYKDARPWSRSIRARVANRTMPPGIGDEGYRPSNDHRRLNDNEYMTILAWVDGGAPEGDPADLPPPPAYLREAWQIGTPDVVLALPRDIVVPAAARLDVLRLEVPTAFATDQWIQAIEIRPTDRTRVHYVFLYEKAGDSGEERLLAFYASGADPLTLPSGMARRIAAGTILVFEMHVVGNGVDGTERTAVAMRLAVEAPREEVRTLAVRNTDFALQAGENEQLVHARVTVNETARLLSVAPHAHRRGRAFRYSLIYPDGRPETILNISRYNWLWQNSYQFALPIEMPAGTVLEVTGVFDNSAANKANPDPRSEVRWGWDPATSEMMFSYIVFAVPRKD